MSGEKVRLACGPALFGFLDEGNDELVELVLEAVIGVQGDINGIALGDSMHVLRNRDRAERRVLEHVPDAKAPPPVETWMMPSALHSARPRSTALAVVSEVTLTAGSAKRPSRARSSIAQ